MKSQHSSLVMLFMAAGKSVKARVEVNYILEEHGTVPMDNDDSGAVFTGLGNEVFPPVLKQLKHYPTVDVSHEDVIDIYDLDINLDHKENIR